MKNVLFMCLILFSLTKIIYSQPFLYFNSKSVDYYSEQSFDIKRYNINSDSVEIIKDYFGKHLSLECDPSQNYLVISEDGIAAMVINCNDSSKDFYLPADIGAPGRILYSAQQNCLFMFSPGGYELQSALNVLDLTTNQIKSIIYLPYDDSGNQIAFFSSDKKNIYFASYDTNTSSDQVWCYSLISNEITSRTNLSSLGLPNAKGYNLKYGGNGIGVIESFFGNNNEDRYYTLYNFSNLSKIITIHKVGSDHPFLCDNQKCLTLVEYNLDPIKRSINNTGKISFYNTSTGNLIKTIILPPNGKAYYFENYPEKLYYTLSDSQQVTPVDLTTLVPSSGLPVKLVASNNNNLTTGTLQYYEGAWKDAVNNNDGTFSVNTTLKTVSLRMTYEGGTQTLSNVGVGKDTVVFRTVNTSVQLKNSSGTLIDQGTVQYYVGAWRDFGTTINGVANKELLPNNYSFRMTYAYASNDKQQNISTDPNVIFQTVNAAVQLKNSSGTLIEQGTMQYYAGAWRDFGTITNGVANKELLPNTYSFRMTYAYASNDKQQNIGTDANVIFQTVNAAVQLKNSSGTLMDQGTVQYYAGAWRDFGATLNGVVNKELLPNSYSFRMIYAYASNDKQQNIGTDPNVIFQTVNAAVQLKNSSGALMDQGTVQYYSGAWRDFGAALNGVANKELLPNSYSFRMTYAYASNDKQQNIGTDPNVIFQTVNAAVQLKNSSATLMDQGTVQYYAGAWRDFGATLNGIVNKELLPNSYSFRMTYAFISKDITQNIGTSNVVNFSTVLCTINVKNAQGQPINNADAKYYSGAWREIGLTSNGIVTKELLPANLSFRINSGTTQQDKTQDLSTSNLVQFNLP
jgi:hypothetical protein